MTRTYRLLCLHAVSRAVCDLSGHTKKGDDLNERDCRLNQFLMRPVVVLS